MRHIKWLLVAGLLLASGPGSRAQFPGPRLEGWRGPGVTGVPTGPLPPGVLPPLPGPRPGYPLGGTGLMGPYPGGPRTLQDVYGDLLRGGPGLPGHPPPVPGGNFVTIPGPGPRRANGSTWPPAGMGPALGAVPPNVPALKITPEMMQAASGGFTPPALPPLPALTPAPQPHGPPEWFRWWYVLAAAGASAVAGLLYGLLRREPAGG